MEERKMSTFKGQFTLLLLGFALAGLTLTGCSGDDPSDPVNVTEDTSSQDSDESNDTLGDEDDSNDDDSNNDGSDDDDSDDGTVQDVRDDKPDAAHEEDATQGADTTQEEDTSTVEDVAEISEDTGERDTASDTSTNADGGETTGETITGDTTTDTGTSDDDPATVVDCGSVDDDKTVFAILDQDDELIFEPPETEISTGGVIEFLYINGTTHTVTNLPVQSYGEGELFDEELGSNTDNVCIEFNQTGTYDYFCKSHGEEASVVVQ